jgi:hypothetical protein
MATHDRAGGALTAAAGADTGSVDRDRLAIVVGAAIVTICVVVTVATSAVNALFAGTATASAPHLAASYPLLKPLLFTAVGLIVGGLGLVDRARGIPVASATPSSHSPRQAAELAVPPVATPRAARAPRRRASARTRANPESAAPAGCGGSGEGGNGGDGEGNDGGGGCRGDGEGNGSGVGSGGGGGGRGAGSNSSEGCRGNAGGADNSDGDGGDPSAADEAPAGGVVDAVDAADAAVAEACRNADQMHKDHPAVSRQSLVNALVAADVAFRGQHEILCRLARAYFKLAQEPGTEKAAQKDLADKALAISRSSLAADDGAGNWRCHLFYGICLNFWASQQGTKSQLENSQAVKAAWLQAAELSSPPDATAMNLLGRWCFAFADMGWVQRRAAGAIFASPPTSTYEEALGYFRRAEEADPG